jgi:putative hydrolase of HD superfamily
MLAMLFSEAYSPNVDSLKVLQLALLHDFGEIDAGDVTPSDGISKSEKIRMEGESVGRVLGLSPVGSSFIRLWNEYQAGESREARLVKQIEKLEMALQACVYEFQNHGDLHDFFESAGSEIEDPELLRVLAELKLLRNRPNHKSNRCNE